MTCCGEFDQLIEREMARNAQPYQLSNGTIVNDVDTEYFLVFGEERHKFVGINYCPFCGRVLSRGLWNLEKKRQG
ncbi:MAG TPA: hypothetical protein VG675_09475 [Bryobacteraceae bacterium]|nr:hypothetical protein [Bryobacteraceae bacterium]